MAKSLNLPANVDLSALEDLHPGAAFIRFKDGFDATHPDLLHSESMILEIKMNPLVHAALVRAGATPAGRRENPSQNSLVVGLGDDTPAGPRVARTLRNVIAPGAIAAKSDLVVADRAPRKFWQLARSRAVSGLSTRFAGTTAAHVFEWRDMAGHMRAQQAWGGVELNPFGCGIMLSHAAGSMRISFVTDDIDSEEHGIDTPFKLGNRSVRESWRRDARPAKPADVFHVADQLAEKGFPIIDETDTSTAGIAKARLMSTVSAWPTPGRPAIATVHVGTKVLGQHQSALQERLGDPATTATSGSSWELASTEVSDVIDITGIAGVDVHRGVLDCARLATCEPVEDERLKAHQTKAVAMHNVTDFGFVQASCVGAGKTVMTLIGMVNQAEKVTRYRGLVVGEANVRNQWFMEARRWTPELDVFELRSRSDAEGLAHALANFDKLIVITSYALVATVLEALDDDGNLSDATIELLTQAASPAPKAAPAEAVAPVAPAPAPQPPAVDDAPATLFVFDDDGAIAPNTSLLTEEPPAPTELPAPRADTAEVDKTERTIPGIGVQLIAEQWNDLVADEAVVLANSSSKASKSLWQIRDRSIRAFALTGTPVNQNLDDLGRLIAWVRNDVNLFRGQRLDVNFDLTDAASLREFADAIGPLVYRVDQSVLDGEIPVLRPTVERVTLTAEERELESSARHRMKKLYHNLLDLLEQASDGDEQAAAIHAELSEAKRLLFGASTLARRAAADPEALRFSESPGVELLEAEGLVSAACANGGSKRRRCIELVAERVRNEGRVLVFTDYPTVARPIISDLRAEGIRAGAVLGGGGVQRDRDIAAFNNGDLDVLVCSAAGEKGLNLQTATAVIHYDLPWVPRSVVQRTGRAVRIGATADEIEIVFMLATGTIEERIAGVVVARAVKAMAALDGHRGVDLRETEMGRLLSALTGEIDENELNDKESGLLALSRVALAD